MFPVGAGMKEQPAGDTLGDDWGFNRLVREMFTAIHECARPVIAAVNGLDPGNRPGAGSALRHHPVRSVVLFQMYAFVVAVVYQPSTHWKIAALCIAFCRFR
ncbi:MAG: hypothetical protein ACJ8AW_02930 [Rhodopila sp.]|jgi:hypothetical protein